MPTDGFGSCQLSVTVAARICLPDAVRCGTWIARWFSAGLPRFGESAVVDRVAIKAEIERLYESGDQLYQRELIAQASGAERKKMVALLAQDPERAELLKKPYFSDEYQSWYSPALRVVEQLLPDRYNEFRNLYKNERRKQLDIETFGIADYIGGYSPVSFGPQTAANRALNCFKQQIAIVGTAGTRLDSVLADIGRALHAEILDDELGEASNLLRDGHIRPAGVVAGVALEGHLKKLIVDHK